MTSLYLIHFLRLFQSVTELESRTGTSFHHANTKRPEEITLREEVASRRCTLLDANDDFGLSPLNFY